jgi:hypothetical protein
MMSAVGHLPKSNGGAASSALPSKAEVAVTNPNFRFILEN